MEHISPSKFFIFILFLACVDAPSALAGGERKSYIIHMDKSARPAPFAAHDNWYTSILTSLTTAEGEAPPKHLYTYNHVLHGFSAVLSPSQLEQVEKMAGHLATSPETYGKLHTTHTPKFLDLKRNWGLWPVSNFGDDIIIGVLDTGIWPESESFNDKGLSPVPERWRGECETGTDFNSSNCNKKLIGARSFSKGHKERGLNISTTDYDSPRDFYGHGTHTSSTAAGSTIRDAEYFGYAKGTAVGIAPMARVAMYKVVFEKDTFESAATDVLAGMDQAISDGVDVMSLSLGFFRTPYYNDVMALGAFAAMEKGIFVACSAGNDGPDAYTILNGAPWITTVGASTIDRVFEAEVTLGDGSMTLLGESIYPESLLVSRVPLYYGNGNRSKETCQPNSLDSKDVSGKIVLCSLGNIEDQRDEVYRAGALGAILPTKTADFLFPQDYYMPFVAVSVRDAATIKDYIAVYPTTATIDIKFTITRLGRKPAPQVTFFSSRGPSLPSPWILKPDVVGPGYQILASWVPNKGDVPIGNDYLVTEYALDSGTSMACPHIAGVAALVKAVHRDWSPAAIRSALMTTSYITDNSNGPILDMTTGGAASPLDFGSGHIDPNKAMDPGLVYDIEPVDYVNFLCALNYTREQIRIITRSYNFTCTNANLDLNYPSFTVILNNTYSTSSKFTRTLTSVSDYSVVYRVAVEVSTGLNVTVQPETLTFDGKNSKGLFTVSVAVGLAGVGINTTENVNMGGYGYLTWHEIGGKHVVRSPIMVSYGP